MVTAQEWRDTIVHLLAPASRLEWEGQYNVAKLARAAHEGLVAPRVPHGIRAGLAQATGQLLCCPRARAPLPDREAAGRSDAW